MEDLFAAGGIGAVMRELQPLLHLDCLTVTGETLAQRLDAPAGPVDRAVVKPLADPLQPVGGLVALFGIVGADRAPSSSARRPTRNCSRRRGGRWCSPRSRICRRASTIPARRDRRTIFWCCKTPGRSRASGMPEAGYLPIPQKLARAGVKDMVRISDARMSGTAYGSIVLHVTPDAAVGRPARQSPQRRPHPPFGQGAPHRPPGSARRTRPPSGRPAADPRARLRPPLPQRDPASRPRLRFQLPAQTPARRRGARVDFLSAERFFYVSADQESLLAGASSASPSATSPAEITSA